MVTAEPSSKRQRTDHEDGIVVMMNGLPGAMGHEVAQACLRAGLSLTTEALGGRSATDTTVVQVVEGSTSVPVQLVGPHKPGAQRKVMDDAVAKYGDRLVVVDFTHPTAVDPNAALYCASGAAFVMGTTGGDRDLLVKTAETSGVYAVIAANMCKQIVALQATMARMAQDFPGAFSGYTMEITESHQTTKADTSGTARDMVDSFQGLGLDFKVDQIRLVRDKKEQLEFGVPASALEGHAFHTYSLKSSDGSVAFQYQHNVCGRRTYAEGVVDAVLFLASRRRKTQQSEQRIFNMIDVLAAGAMR
jgi:4-hydroxy-tetrahydrodipicolinate reductase